MAHEYPSPTDTISSIPQTFKSTSDLMAPARDEKGQTIDPVWKQAARNAKSVDVARLHRRSEKGEIIQSASILFQGFLESNVLGKNGLLCRLKNAEISGNKELQVLLTIC